MFNIKRGRKYTPVKSGLSKRDRTYNSIQEYISDINGFVELDVHPFIPKNGDWKDQILDDLTEEQFISFLKCLDNFLKLEYDPLVVQNPLTRIVDINTFYDELSKLMNSIANSFVYDRKKKRFIVHDVGLHRISSNILQLNTYRLVQAQKYMSKELWNYAIGIYHIIWERAIDSKLYDQWLDYLQYGFEDSMCDSDTEEETKAFETKTYCGKALNNIISDLIREAKPCSIDINKLDGIELKIAKALSIIANFDTSVLKHFIDPTDYKDIYEDYDDEKHRTWNDSLEMYGAEVPISEFYNAGYILGYNNDEEYENDIIDSYVDWINSEENECWFLLNVTGQIQYSKTAKFCSRKKERDMAVDYHYAFSDVNNLLKKLYDDKISETSSS